MLVTVVSELLIIAVLFTTSNSLLNSGYKGKRLLSSLSKHHKSYIHLKALSSNHNAGQQSDKYTAVMIIPTGVAATIGGYAGDGLPSAKLLSTVVDTLITHPNVVNGAMLYWPMDNLQYVEGYSLDEFAAGRLALKPTVKKAHKIGLLLDKGIEPDLLLRHIQVAEGMRATLGIDVNHCVVTSEPVGVNTRVSEQSGASWGSVNNTATLLQGAQELIDRGCAAIAVVTRFPEDEEKEEKERFAQYRLGQGVDAIAGVEALISHVIAKKLQVPVAHAPAFAYSEVDPMVSPKACAEELGHTFLPCVLANLHRAPTLVPTAENSNSNTANKMNSGDYSQSTGLLRAADVDVCVVPYNALGGPAVLSFLTRGTLVVCVEENDTAMRVDPSSIVERTNSASASGSGGNVVIVNSYLEAAGLVAAHKAGIMIDSVSRLNDASSRSMPITRL